MIFIHEYHSRIILPRPSPSPGWSPRFRTPSHTGGLTPWDSVKVPRVSTGPDSNSLLSSSSGCSVSPSHNSLAPSHFPPRSPSCSTRSSWLYYFNSFTWVVSAMISTGLHGLKIKCMHAKQVFRVRPTRGLDVRCLGERVRVGIGGYLDAVNGAFNHRHCPTPLEKTPRQVGDIRVPLAPPISNSVSAVVAPRLLRLAKRQKRPLAISHEESPFFPHLSVLVLACTCRTRVSEAPTGRFDTDLPADIGLKFHIFSHCISTLRGIQSHFGKPLM